VIAAHGMGGDGNTADTQNVNTVSPLIEVAAPKTTGNWVGHVSAYENVPTAGAGTYAFTGGSTTGVATIAAEFLAVPEPSALALLGLGGLALLRRRR
jgi:hypothetical protein